MSERTMRKFDVRWPQRQQGGEMIAARRGDLRSPHAEGRRAGCDKDKKLEAGRALKQKQPLHCAPLR